MSESLVNNLCFIRTEDKLLLARKKRGFGAGKWNGYGGKVMAGETLEESAVREIEEEAGLKDIKLEKRGLINFSWASAKNRPIECHIFEITEYQGEPTETEEMNPQWFPIDNLPYNHMWSDDPIWLPLFLSRRGFRADFVFNDDDSVKNHSLKELSFPLDF